MGNNKYKDTLLIGQTTFEMRAGLKDKEPLIEKFWEDKAIYKQRLKANENKELFMLHDGPPYANGDLHIGHALNKSLKDFIIRWKNSNGYNAPFIMGWDTHGLPIETAVTKTGVDRKNMEAAEFRKLCEKYALEQVKNQSQQFKRLGMFTDYDINYLTLRPDFEISELKLFAKMFNDGLIYKALKPIYWSPSSESALAESEIEYADIKSPTIFVACQITRGNQFVNINDNLLIWTTTPWTIPANQLIAVGEMMDYSLITSKSDKRKIVVASSLIKNVTETIGWENPEVLANFKGKDLVNVEYAHPLYETKISKVVLGHHVTDEAGTGLVHIASGFGEDDYLIAKNNNLEIFAPIDNQGKFTSEVMDENLVGKFYDDTNKEIVQRLDANQKLLKLKFVTHSYPHDWRTKKPVIYRATLQWFVGLNKAKEKILNHVDEIQTNPKWAKSRLYQVLDDRTDWTISRQRLWGVPILGFYDQDDNLVLNAEILDYTIRKIEELGTNSWFSEPADVFLPEKFKNKDFKKEKDILDVWFDSGTSAIALEERFPNLKRPFNVYLEGNDQYRGWFNASMINSVVYDDKSPYNNLISHGMTTDEKGRKMSKSLGNGINPIEFANDSGTDILRLWVASTDYTDDQKIGPEIIKQISESYRKIRNTMRFILANINDFDENKNYQEKLEEVDLYALNNLSEFKNKAIRAFDNYQFNQVYNLVINYVTNDLSAFYLDFIKDILYIESKDNKRRRQVQTVLFEQLWALLDILRPILVHTVEEAYQSTSDDNKNKSVHLLDLKDQDFVQSHEFVKRWETILKFKDDINKSLEEAKIAGVVTKGFEAKIDVQLKDEFKFISEIKNLEQIFIVGEINFVSKDSQFIEREMSFIKISTKQGLKCQRCWGIFSELIDQEICQRCNNIVNNK
ncbi:isoleucyl-tRNA synthetase [Williamsoniiplasma somnilux]|uniref:Isoleucine--tRNA ligase n=1 Tax=Williamsoniiplasma somnilux TaxID=215578 RepID=A0A2K8NXW1_9MOLU|nr:isoleucine--tRNA ligase [Williamsoniiplasma somnilux]ATZ18672.1 isoleucyl-tRNA synthetase [Williamsoniiplasma somnilux]